jgi:manganese oxidase
VVAERNEHLFAGKALTDPWGLIYRNVTYSKAELKAAFEKAEDKRNGETWEIGDEATVDQRNAPLVLRAHPGEWIRLVLINNVIDDVDLPTIEDDGQVEFGPEISAARLPIESLDNQFRPDRRTVSARVSIHPSLLTYDVRSQDGSFVGLNPDSTVAMRPKKGAGGAGHAGMAAEGGAVIARSDHNGTRNWREYWYADPKLAPQEHRDGCGQVCYLNDMADIRNHRHHGLIGAIIVEPSDVFPYRPGSTARKPNGWSGLDAELRDRDGNIVARESCWFVQDGLRFFANGNPDFPLPDVNPTDDPEDSGQKGVNYRSHPVCRGVVAPDDGSGEFPDPIVEAKAGDTLWLRVIGANDKPRQHGVVVHGASLKQASWMGNNSPLLGAMGGISPCRVQNFVLPLPHKGDHSVRSSCFRWGTEHGVWATVRVK